MIKLNTVLNIKRYILDLYEIQSLSYKKKSFLLSVINLLNQMRHWTFCYEMGFMLSDFYYYTS